MSAVPPLPPETHPLETAARVHRMRVARGACWVIVAALLAGAFLAVLDATVVLPAWVRGVGLAIWLTGFGVLVWRLVARRLPPDPSTTAGHARAELAGNLRAAAAAALALAAALSVATLVPGAGEHIRRVTLPWTRNGGPIQYRVVVTAGEPVVRRGDRVTLSAYAEKVDPSAAIPKAATLTWRDRGGREMSLPMSGDGTGAFHATRANVMRAFEYRVEVGSSSSDWFTVFVLDPVEPTALSRIEVFPPAYAPMKGPPTVTGFTSITAHQYSTAVIHLRFSQPAAAAFLEWRSDEAAAMELIPLTLDAERLAARAMVKLKAGGSLKLVTVAEAMGKSLRSEHPVRVSVAPDTPPRFERLVGLSQRPRTARPDARVGIDFTALDDLAVGSATIEYVVGADDAKMVSQPLALLPSFGQRVRGQFNLDLSGKARAGDEVRLRLRIGDTRQVDQPALEPQTTTYPGSGWSVVRIDPAAPPLEEQEIVADRNALGDALVGALEAIKSCQTEIAAIRRDTANKRDLPLEETVRLTNLRDSLRELAGPIRAAGREAALRPSLQELARLVLRTSEEPFRTVDEALKRAATNRQAERSAALTSAIDALGSVMGELDRHLTVNQQIAQARFDHRAISALVTDQAAVADLAQPGGAIGVEELTRLERELHARLSRLIADSDPLRAATETAKENDVRRLAVALQELTGFIRDLNAAAQFLEFEARRSLLGEAARTHARILGEGTKLLKRAESAARLAEVDLRAAKELARIGGLIRAGRTVEALTELETNARALDTIAASLEKWVADQRDPRLAVRQLARWQEDLRLRLGEAVKDRSGNFQSLPESMRVALRNEQRALLEVLSELRLPPTVKLQSLKKDAARQVSTPAEAVEPARLAAFMASAVGALNRLADAIPAIPERLTKARAALALVLQAQEAILLEVEQAIRTGDAGAKLRALSERQSAQFAVFAGLDLPGAESRAAVIEAALRAATKDLREGVASDATASQQWLKRELDRLRVVLDGQSAPDDRAVDLARKFHALERTLARFGPSPTQDQLRGAGAEAQELGHQVAALGNPPEAVALVHEARAAASRLEVAARGAAEKPADFRKQLRVAVETMDGLASRLTSAETEHDRVRRLAANRWADWDNARRLQGRPPNPAASAETRRRLGWEAEELALTRVGLVGQAIKKMALDQYQRLKEHDAPDRQGGPLKALAQSLDDLSAVMADIEDLCTPTDRGPSSPRASAADPYLPRPALAAAFRELAHQGRSLRQQIARVNDEAAVLLRPGDSKRVAALEKEQRELASALTALARQLEREKDDADKMVLGSAIHATLAANGLANGMCMPASGSAAQAVQDLRNAAAVGGNKSWVRTASDLALRQEAIRTRMKERMALPELSAQQKARGEELAGWASQLAERLAQGKRVTGRMELAAAAKECAAVEQIIREATRRGAQGGLADASRLRTEAVQRLADTAEKVAAVVQMGRAGPDQDPATLRAAESLMRADLAMRQALDVLEAKADRAEAERAMRRVVEALAAAAQARGGHLGS